MNIADLRREYAKAALGESDVAADPIAQFELWFAEAREAESMEPNAMTLSTADRQGRPSGRIVLLKGVDAQGFVFFTDYRSRKAAELEANPFVALTFHWAELQRQVRVTGRVERTSTEESWAYYRTRPEGSRLGAWASHQSEPILDRATLERQLTETKAEFTGREIPLPPHWGGYRIAPDTVEFWQGRPNRLHDRIVYTRDEEKGWQRARLSP